MSLFLLTFFIIYGGAHCYALTKLTAVLRMRKTGYVVAAFFIVLMVSLPVATRILEHQGLETAARATAYAGYLWMGFLFLFISAALFLDVLRLVFFVGRRLLPGKMKCCILPADKSFRLAFATALLAGIYASFEAGNLQMEKVTLLTDKLPAHQSHFRIVLISDVHLGLIVGPDKLERIIALTKEANPDLLVSTGDLVEGHIMQHNRLAEMFNSVKPPYGKYAVTGNHEYYAGILQSIYFTRQAGFTLLQGEKTEINGWLTIAGFDDKTGIDLDTIAEIDRDDFVLLLKHRPTATPEMAEKIDLQLSGHIHKGQIFPFNFITKIAYPAPAGLSYTREGGALYVSRGTGTWGPPLRLFSPPEITVIDLVKPSSLNPHLDPAPAPL